MALVHIDELSPLMLKIFETTEEIDLVSKGIGIEGGVFGAPSLRSPTKLYPTELGFLRVVSWLYVMYYELGKVDIEFLTNKLEFFNLDGSLQMDWDSIPGGDEPRLCEYLGKIYNINLYEKYSLYKIDGGNAIRLQNNVHTVVLTKIPTDSSISLRIGGVIREELQLQSEGEKATIRTKDRSLHPILVNSLRTYLQHNLSSNNEHSIEVKRTTEKWLIRICGTPVPEGEEIWMVALSGLLKESLDFLQGILGCVRKIENDDLRDKLIEDWLYQRGRYHPPHEFDKLISEISADMGRDGIDPVKFRKKHYDEWISELKLCKSGYDFPVEARRLIERALLDKNEPILPITGNDIIEKLGIPPGPRVGEYLERARHVYASFPCKAEELLRRLDSEK